MDESVDPLAILRALYQKYRHMDNILSDRERWVENDFTSNMLADLWQAIKQTLRVSLEE